jgi:hypothetical protein
MAVGFSSLDNDFAESAAQYPSKTWPGNGHQQLFYLFHSVFLLVYPEIPEIYLVG